MPDDCMDKVFARIREVESEAVVVVKLLAKKLVRAVVPEQFKGRRGLAEGVR